MNATTVTTGGPHQKRKCEHGRVVVEETGLLQFTAGDILDTRKLHLVCRDCGAELDHDTPKDDEDLPF